MASQFVCEETDWLILNRNAANRLAVVREASEIRGVRGKSGYPARMRRARLESAIGFAKVVDSSLRG
ncbi:MAG: hypothetical protein KDA59_10500, partial [Planctomycetales bacterium]|nr:hypothetical protein [Planctomycetales bacterium]